jgi:hypothetical protein
VTHQPYATPQEHRRRNAAAKRLDRVHDAETWQSYWPDHATNEAHPPAGIDAVHHHFATYLNTHPTQPGETT